MTTDYAQGYADARAAMTNLVATLREAARRNAGPGVDQWAWGYVEALDDIRHRLDGGR